ncbi:MAG: branched-chain amino acid ABC transporter permease [Actinomycetota bacterium]|jgi:branched-chain amino acid transport system permease protein|nr:branched-chain amino acid ABC transporter permease [Actinomycetota bacterium]
MSLFLQRTFDSLANGSAYAALAVAISMVFRSTGVLNLAQGQMAMFSTYVAVVFASAPGPAVEFSGLVDDFGTPWPVWLAIVAAVVVSAAMGALIERVVIRPLGDQDPVPAIGATLGLFLFFDAFVRKHWTGRTRFLGSPFPDEVEDRFDIGGARLWHDTLGITITMIAALSLLALVQRRTRLGLAFRAVTSNRQSSVLAGIRVDRVVMIGWALAAAVGGLAGGLIAGHINVHPNMMGRLLIFGLAAATLGGLRSPALAFVGGYLFAFAETMMGGYVGFIDSQVTLVWALGVLIVVLSIRPSGLLSKSQGERIA